MRPAAGTSSVRLRLTPAGWASYDGATFRSGPCERTFMHGLEDFADIVKPNEPLAPYTYFKVGGGANVLVRDEGVRGAVLRLSASAFTQVTVEGRSVRCGTGAPLSALIS